MADGGSLKDLHLHSGTGIFAPGRCSRPKLGQGRFRGSCAHAGRRQRMQLCCGSNLGVVAGLLVLFV